LETGQCGWLALVSMCRAGRIDG